MRGYAEHVLLLSDLFQDTILTFPKGYTNLRWSNVLKSRCSFRLTLPRVNLTGAWEKTLPGKMMAVTGLTEASGTDPVSLDPFESRFAFGCVFLGQPNTRQRRSCRITLG
jgi:hypothetical protein